MAGIDGWLARKYQIQQEQADAGSRLQGAQAANITASTPSEIALRRAQAFQTNQQGLTTGPLSEASIAATRAGIGETQARAGLFGAQAQDIRANSLSPINDIGQSTIYRNMSQTYSPNVGAYSTSPDYTSIGGGLISGVPAGGLGSVPSPTPDITANRPSNYGVTEIGGTSSMDRNDERHYARGTSNVTQNRGVMAQTQNRGVPAYEFGTRNVATPPVRVKPVPETGTAGVAAGPGPGQLHYRRCLANWWPKPIPSRQDIRSSGYVGRWSPNFCRWHRLRERYGLGFAVASVQLRSGDRGQLRQGHQQGCPSWWPSRRRRWTAHGSSRYDGPGYGVIQCPCAGPGGAGYARAADCASRWPAWARCHASGRLRG